MPDNLPKIDPGWLSPYASFLVIQCVAEDLPAAIQGLLNFVKNRLASPRGSPAVLLATSIAGVDNLLRSPTADGSGHDQVEGVLYRREKPPSWAIGDFPFADREHQLITVMRRGPLIAVQSESALRRSLWHWINHEPRPPFRPVPAAILQGAFVRGVTRNLWLHGTHPPSPTKADSKVLSGPNLGEALNPLEDSSYAAGSARTRLPQEEGREALGRDVGTTARRGMVWLRPTHDFADFLEVAKQMLLIVEETIAGGAGVEQPFPVLTTEADDLTGAQGAYEIACPGPDEILADPNVAQDALDAAEFLQHCVLNVRAISDSSDLLVDIGTEGIIRGRLRCTVTARDGHPLVTFGFEGGQSNEQVARQIRNALELLSESLSIYYLSGHCIRRGGIFKYEIRNMPFLYWRFEDFSGCDILKEKPAQAASEIHRTVGEPSDNSLFGWVVRRYQNGWLTCDDGSGEVADFVHLDDNGTLTLLHVKAATNDTEERRVSASAYEVVAGQASKNIGFLNATSILHRLSDTNKRQRATWQDGVREIDRSGFLVALAARPPAAPIQVLIVQPHLRETRYNHLRSTATSDEDGVRLRRLETLLNSTAGGIIGVGARFQVIASS